MQFRMRRYTSLLAMVALAVLTIAGCGGNREAGLPGTWKVDAAAMTKAIDDAAKSSTDPKAKAGMEMAKNMMGTASLELKQDKTFVMTMGLPMEGTWAFDDAASTVSLAITKMMGMDLSKMPNMQKDANKPLVCTLSADGRQLSVQPQAGQPAGAGGAMTFIKQ